MPSEIADDLTPLPLERVQQLAQVEHNTPMVYRMALEILSLRKDRDRLDWLGRQAAGDFWWSEAEHQTLRDAIDAAMEQKP